MNLFNKFIDKFGWKGLLQLLFYPVIVIVATPFRFFQALWECRILLNGKWSHYNRFNPHRGINSFFYWTQALNIDKFGRNGVSNLISDGDFKLSNWFHLSLFSIYSYWRFGGAVVPIVGLFGWLFFNLLWLNQVELSVVLIVLASVMLSSTFYANMFEMQNYNALGWMFFPIGVYGLYTGNWWIAGLGWFLVSLGSFTAVFIAGILSLTFALYNFSIFPIVAMIPAGLKISLHFLPLLNNLDSINNVLKNIGASKKGLKYVRNKTSLNNVRLLFFLILYIQFILFEYITTQNIDILFISLILLFILNESGLFRFADPGSLHMPIMSIAIVIILLHFNIYLFISFLILLNAPAIFLDFTDKSLIIVPKRKPFNVKNILDNINNFLNIESNKIMFCFENPNNKYGKIFDGYRVVLEAFLYVASNKNIHLFPDWYFIWKYNYINAPECWGRELNEVLNNVKNYKVKYIIIYEKENENLLNDFLQYFELINTFSIKKKDILYSLTKGDIDFHLLKVKE